MIRYKKKKIKASITIVVARILLNIYEYYTYNIINYYYFFL